ncbi:GDSL-type esterase/lipase family protein [Akkermansia muciniphila]|uniref:GDSL-type esterase/lipase family protein n=1 Tax=Akkermansia muciniphila TaxID=239935 RepID=UPI001606D858|nr:GDSL-type esterase/lipase family protein [Akkermansia muciniphila]
MKIRLPLPLLAALAAAFPAATAAPAGTELGNVMYVGDSITHGVNSASYRWALHKIFTDNGISYQAEGVKTGNYSGGVTAGTSYGGQIFNNEHSSQASARAWEISGRNSGSRFDGSNIYNWLGLSGTKANGNAYSGQTFTGDNTPDTFFMMIGTNDLLSDGNNATLADRLDSVSQNLLNDMDTIVEAMFQANEHANVIILTIPCWTRHSNGNSDATHQAVADYNDRLKTWGNGRQNVTVIDINAGLIDVTSSTPFYGVSSMFNNPGSDGLHPNAQGDLLMAGNIARAMGYAGRTAGQERKDAGGLAINFHQGGQSPAWSSNSQLENKGFSLANVTVDENGISLGQSGESSISYSWAEGTELQNGFTFDCNLVLGNGAADGWDTASDFSISLGNSSFYGTLNINEAYIKWGDAILYSLDMSANAENLRMAYICGNDMEGLKGGYYVWLGDMLIGEALSVTSGSGCNGLTIQYNGSGTAVLHDLALDGTGSYAPATSGMLNAEKSFISSGSFTQGGTPEGNIEWKTEGFTKTADNLASSGTFNARSQADSSAGGTGNSVNVSITSGNATHIYANSGNYTGDVWLTISKEGQASAWYGAHGASGTLNGNAFLRFTDAATGGSTVFGAVNAAGVTGNVYLEFSAENASFGTFTSSNSSSVVGSYATDIQGNVDIVVNSGTFNHQIMGGIFANARTGTTTIGGNTHVYINGGSVTGNVMGGGLTGSISGGANVTVTGGVISGSVYGAGQGGSILAGSSVCLTGGLVKGDVYAGGKAGSIQGDTSVTITGNTATLYNGSSWGSISGGGSGGTVEGNSTVRIQNLSSGTTAYGFDKYAGNISGGTNVSGDRSLVLDHVTVDSLLASLSDFTHISAVNQTRTSLDSLGEALTVTIEAGSSLILNGTSDLTTLILGEHASLTLQGLTADAVIVDITGTTNYTLSLTEIPASLDNIKFLNDGVLYDAAMSMDLQANSAMLFAQVPEPGSAALALAGLAPSCGGGAEKCPIEALRFLQALMDKRSPRRRNAGGGFPCGKTAEKKRKSIHPSPGVFHGTGGSGPSVFKQFQCKLGPGLQFLKHFPGQFLRRNKTEIGQSRFIRAHTIRIQLKQVDNAQMHGPHVIGIVINHAENPLGAVPVNNQFLADFALHSGQIGGNVVMAGLAVHRIDMASDANGALVMQAGLAAGASARVMQNAALVAENGIGDDLFVGRIIFRSLPVHERGDARLHERIQIMIPAFPVSLEITRFLKGGAGNHQNLFSMVT